MKRSLLAVVVFLTVAAPAEATSFHVFIGRDANNTPAPATTMAGVLDNDTNPGNLVISPYQTDLVQTRDPNSVWKYTVRSGDGIAIMDDGDGDPSEDDPEGHDANDPDDNCQYYEVGTQGGTTGPGAFQWVRCKVITATSTPGASTGDVISTTPQAGAPPFTIAHLGGAGNDLITIGERVSGNVNGGPGTDTLAIASDAGAANWTVDLGAGTASSSAGDSFTAGEFENFTGGHAEAVFQEFISPDYAVAGTNEANDIDTTGGNDEIVAGAGNDDIHANGFFYTGHRGDSNDIDAGPDHDDVTAGVGGDLIDLGSGNDTGKTVGGPDAVTAGAGNDLVQIGQEALQDLDGDGINDQVAANVSVDGGEGDDTVQPAVFVLANKPVGSFILDGGAGIDKLTGAHGNDDIRGGDGNDDIKAGAGDDLIRGGPGDDLIDCGPGEEDVVLDQEPGDTLTNCEGKLLVLLETSGLDDDDDLFTVELQLLNTTKEEISSITPKGSSGLALVPGVFSEEDAGQVARFFDSGEPYPATLAAGATFTRTFQFLTLDLGKVLLQAEVSGTNSKAQSVRDAEYAEVLIEPKGESSADVWEQMGAIEAFATDAHDGVIDQSEKWGKKRAKDMQSLPKGVRKRWLGSSKGGAKVRPIDEAVAHMHGMSPEELATEVPRGDVIKKGGQRKISEAKRAVLNADTGKEEEKARRELRRVRNAQTLTSSESMAFYNKARMETDNNELYKIYEDFAEKPAKALWKGGGATFDWLLMSGSFEGRQQMEADLVRFAESNNQSLSESWWVWSNPSEAYDLSTEQFHENLGQYQQRRANREDLKQDLYKSDPEKAIYLAAQDDSWYSAQVLRGFMELMAPGPSAKFLDTPITWGGKAATSKASRASVMAAEATKQGDALAGQKIFNGAEDLGEGGMHADDFTFPSADPDELLKLDQLGKKGGAGMRDQRIAEQINREVTEQLHKEFADADIEFNMFFRPKKDYDPVGSLAKPQAFSEKSLDPRSIEVLGAPPAGLGKLVIFLPDHPSKFPGWKNLPAIEKQADLELYDLHLDQWTNFHKQKPKGKTADWKPALKEKTKIEFGGDHSVELKLEKHELGKNAFEIRATEMRIDGTKIYKGKQPVSIGGDLDPLIAVDSNAGKKLAGEIETRALEIWNQKAVKAQKELGFRSGGHGATAHGDDVTPEQWAKFAKYAAVHLTPEEQLLFEALVVARAGLPPGTKILPAGLKANEHLVRTTISDTFVGPLGTVLD